MIWTVDFEFVLVWIHVTVHAILVGLLRLVSVPGFEPWSNLPILILVQYNHHRAGIKALYM